MTPVTVNERRASTSSYLATPAAVGIARNAAKLAILRWGLTGEKAEDVCLVVSELVTNSMNAAKHTEIRVTVAEDMTGQVTVEVWTRPPQLPQRGLTNLTDLSGRGLWIVQKLAIHCGAHHEDGRKVAFAVL